jgi:hypothetical protein
MKRILLQVFAALCLVTSASAANALSASCAVYGYFQGPNNWNIVLTAHYTQAEYDSHWGTGFRRHAYRNEHLPAWDPLYMHQQTDDVFENFPYTSPTGYIGLMAGQTLTNPTAAFRFWGQVAYVAQGNIVDWGSVTGCPNSAYWG